jgi:hypothetical protein
MWGVEPASSAYLAAAGVSRGERDKRFRRVGRDLWVPRDAEFDEREQLLLLWSKLPTDDVCTFGAGIVTTPERTYLDVARAQDRERLARPARPASRSRKGARWGERSLGAFFLDRPGSGVGRGRVRLGGGWRLGRGGR